MVAVRPELFGQQRHKTPAVRQGPYCDFEAKLIRPSGRMAAKLSRCRIASRRMPQGQSTERKVEAADGKYTAYYQQTTTRLNCRSCFARQTFHGPKTLEAGGSEDIRPMLMLPRLLNSNSLRLAQCDRVHETAATRRRRAERRNRAFGIPLILSMQFEAEAFVCDQARRAVAAQNSCEIKHSAVRDQGQIPRVNSVAHLSARAAIFCAAVAMHA